MFSKIKLGKKKFKIKNDHVIYRYNANLFTLFAGASLNPILLYLMVEYAEPFYIKLSIFKILGSFEPIILLSISLLITFKSRLARQVIVFDRKNQTATSYYLFSIRKRKTEFKNLYYNYKRLSGVNSGALCYLSEDVSNGASGKISIVNYIMFSEHDDRFFPDLIDYMNYEYTSENAKEQMLQSKIKRKNMWKRKSLEYRINELLDKPIRSRKISLQITSLCIELSEVLEKLDETKKALAFINTGIKILGKYRKESPEIYESLLCHKGHYQLSLGKNEKALESFTLAYKICENETLLHIIEQCKSTLN